MKPHACLPGLIACLLALTAAPTLAQQGQKLHHLKWLQGTWSTDARSMNGFTESWRLENDTVLTGSGIGLKNGQVVSKEQLRLCERGSSVIYMAKVPGQNNGQFVPFTLAPAGMRSFRFENKGHDFPKVIVYNRLGPDSLLVELFGASPKPAMTLRFGRK